MTVREQAAQLLERDGLLQDGRPYAHHQGYSITGSVQSAVNHNPFQSSASSRKLVQQIADELGVDDLQAWNDKEGRTKDEVLEALRGRDQQLSFTTE